MASKAAGFVVLLQLLSGPFLGLADLMIPVLGFIAAATILFGNMTAVTQRNTKRLMGLSGIAHAGYLLVGVVAYASGVEWARYAVLFYLFTYLFGSFAVFGVMSLAAGAEDADQELDHYGELRQEESFLGGVLRSVLGRWPASRRWVALSANCFCSLPPSRPSSMVCWAFPSWAW